MVIKFMCSRCLTYGVQDVHSLPDAMRGKTVLCPSCKSRIIVPQINDDTVDVAILEILVN